MKQQEIPDLFFFFNENGDSAALSFSLMPDDTEYKGILLDLDTLDFWTDNLILKGIRLDPVDTYSAGEIYIDFIRFLKNLIEVRTEGGVAEIKGIGKSLQLFAAEVPSLNAIDVNWSVDNPGIATIDSSGLLTSVSDGVVTVTATAKNESGYSGTITLVVTDTGQKTAWEFNSDLEGWDKNPHGGSVAYSDSMLVFNVTDADPYVYKNVSPWKVGNLKFLWMRIKNETAASGGAFYIFPASGGNGFVPFSLIPNDSVFRDIYVAMNGASIWNKNLVLDNIRLDPNNGGEAGDIYVDFIRFLEEVVVVGSEGNATGISGLGNTLQLFATPQVPVQSEEFTWQVDKPEVAVIDSAGLLTSVSEGEFKATATVKDNQAVYGTLTLNVTVDHTAVESLKSNSPRLYPNPSNAFVNLDQASDIKSISILNVYGQVMLKTANTSSIASINTESLSPGVYLLLAISYDGKYAYFRFIKN